MSEALLQATRTLARTLQTAVGAYQQLKAENAELEQTLKTLKDRDKAYREKLVGELKELFPGFCGYEKTIPEVGRVCALQEDDDILRNEKIIRGLHRLLTTGLGSMYMFVKTSRLKTPILLDVTRSIIKLKDAPRKTELQARKFQGVFQKTDKDRSSPGSANFEVFRASLVADLEIMQQIGGSYFMLAFGPSGTGKTTMITHILDEFLPQSKSVTVSQLYVRDLLHESSPGWVARTEETRKNVVQTTDKTRATVYELFRLVPSNGHSLTHIYLNEIEQIHSLGLMLYKKLNELKEALEILFATRQCVQQKIITAKAAMSYITFITDKTEFEKSYLGLNKALLSEENNFEQARELQQFYNQCYEERNDCGNFTAKGKQFVGHPVSHLKASDVISQLVPQIVQDFKTLKLRVKKRIVEEEFFVKSEQREQIKPDNAFWVSGGFIPLIWLQYGDDSLLPPFVNIDTKLSKMDSYYRKLYVEESGVPMFDPGSTAFRFTRETNFPIQQLNKLPSYVHSQLYSDLVLRGKQILQDQESLKTYRIQDTEKQPFFLVNENEYVPEKNDPNLKKNVYDFSFQRSTLQNRTSSRSVIMYKLVLKNNQQVTLIDLPGNEDQIGDCERVPSLRCDETRGIHHLLDVVKAYLVAKKRKEGTVTYNRPHFPKELSPLLKEVFDPMLDPKAKASFMFFAANYMTSPNFVQNAESAMRYIEELQA